MTGADDTLTALKQIGAMDDASIPLGETALLLASFDHSGLALAPYRAHLAELASDASMRLGAIKHPEAVAAALSEVLAARHGYYGDSASYEDMQNADLIRVIDRRRGLPVALGILYLETAKRLGVVTVGLNSPGHFVVRVGPSETGVILDPFNGGVSPTPAVGPFAESPDNEFHKPVSPRDVLLRLLNNILQRAQSANDHARTVSICERMTLVAPARPELWLELAKANEAVGKLINAMRAYENCMRIGGENSGLGREAALMLISVRRRLN
jgi:regulator of sirC expression with transglutaminase-like and TPR domain